jgi:hypothetical protein
MRWRTFITALGAVAWPVMASGQEAPPMVIPANIYHNWVWIIAVSAIIGCTVAIGGFAYFGKRFPLPRFASIVTTSIAGGFLGGAPRQRLGSASPRFVASGDFILGPYRA